MSIRLYIYELPQNQYRKMILTRKGRTVKYRDSQGGMDSFQEDVEVALPFPAFTPLKHRRI